MENENNIVINTTSCDCCLWEGRCDDKENCEDLHFISDEHFENEVLPRLREEVEPRRERNFNLDEFKDLSEEFYNAETINDVLHQIRHHEIAYIFNTDQIRDVLSFEPDANVVLDDGIFYVSLS
jgi:hypothetical protein